MNNKIRKIKFKSLMIINVLVFLFSLFLITACDKSGKPNQTKIEANTVTKFQEQSSVDSIDVCSLLSKNEVEQIAGKPVLDPESEQLANLFTCTYGDPEYPDVSIIVSISVFICSNSSDAKEILDMTRSNAASVEEISNFGDYAYWDKILRTLWILKGNYEIGIEAASDAGGFDSAKKIALKVLERLP